MSNYNGSTPDAKPARAWLKAAACFGLDDAMFPDSNAADIAAAKAICHSCPVFQHCRQWALDTRQKHGVWGGLTEPERRSIHRHTATTEAAA